MQMTDPSSDGPMATSDIPTSPPDGSNRSIAFVAVFLGVTIALLLLFRFSVGSDPMARYLYTVAQTTTWSLNAIGSSARIGNIEPVPADTTAARALIAKHFNQAQSSRTEPLGGWERFQYDRAAMQANLELEQTTLSTLQAPEEVVIKSVNEHIQFLDRSIQKIDTEMRRIGEGSPLLTPVSVESQTKLAQLKDALARISATQNPDPQIAGPMLLQIQNESNMVRESLIAVIQDRIRIAQHLNGESGPVIDFTLRAPTITESGPIGGLQFLFRIVAECGALESISIFIAGVLAFPTTIRKRMLGLMLGLPTLFLVNVFRLTCLGVIGAVWGNGEVFDFAHHYVWQGIYLIFVVMVWLIWLAVFVLPKPAPSSPSPVKAPLVLLAKFFAFVPIVATLWWFIMPVYLHIAGETSAWTLRTMFARPLDGASVERDSRDRTPSALSMPVLVYHNNEARIPLRDAWSLAANVVPFIALVLATPGLGMKRILRVLATGFAILAAGHIVYLVLIVLFAGNIAKASQVPTAVAQAFLTLPFLLWIVLAYGRQTRALFARNPPDPKAT